jgi:carbohydrate kinase (thermoresistant glucokinase family)
MTRAIVVMGPSACGKTTLARALARELGWQYLEGDDLHPAANRDKMTAGIPLGDADRQPWLERIAASLAEGPKDGGIVVACSALKRRYRDVLRGSGVPVTFVLPAVPREELAARLAHRTGHFMPPSLLDSQLRDLQPLAPDEDGITVDGTKSTEQQLADIRARLSC